MITPGQNPSNQAAAESLRKLTEAESDWLKRFSNNAAELTAQMKQAGIDIKNAGDAGDIPESARSAVYQLRELIRFEAMAIGTASGEMISHIRKSIEADIGASVNTIRTINLGSMHQMVIDAKMKLEKAMSGMEGAGLGHGTSPMASYAMSKGKTWDVKGMAESLAAVKAAPFGQGRTEAAREHNIKYGGLRAEMLASKGGYNTAEVFVAQSKRMEATSSSALTNLASKIGGVGGAKITEAMVKRPDASSNFAEKMLFKIAQSESGGKQTGIEKVGSAIVDGIASKVLPSLGVGNLAMSLGPMTMLAAAVGKLFMGAVEERRQMIGSAIPALTGTKAGYSGYLAGADKHRLDLAASGKFLEFKQTADSAIGKLGLRSGMAEGQVNDLSDSLMNVQKSGMAFGLSAGQSADMATKLARATGPAGLDGTFNKLLKTSLAVGLSADEMQSGLGDFSFYARQFGESKAKETMVSLLAQAEGIQGTESKMMYVQNLRSMMGASLPKQMGMMYAAYGGEGGLKAWAEGNPATTYHGAAAKLFNEQIAPSFAGESPIMRQFLTANSLGDLMGLDNQTKIRMAQDPAYADLLRKEGGYTEADLKSAMKLVSDKSLEASGMGVLTAQTAVLEIIANTLQGGFNWLFNTFHALPAVGLLAPASPVFEKVNTSAVPTQPKSYAKATASK